MSGSARPALLCAAFLTLLLTGCAAQDQTSSPDGGEATGTLDRDTRQYLEDAVAAYEGRLPLRIHENGELVGLATYANVLEFTFKFSNLGRNGQADRPLLKQIMTSVIGIVGCRNPKITEWLAKGVVFRYRFLDDAGATFAEQDLEELSCAS